MENIDVFAPLASLQWVDRNTIHANDYNPNKVSEENLKLLVQSILTNGWTLPIVVRQAVNRCCPCWAARCLS